MSVVLERTETRFANLIESYTLLSPKDCLALISNFEACLGRDVSVTEASSVLSDAEGALIKAQDVRDAIKGKAVRFPRWQAPVNIGGAWTRLEPQTLSTKGFDQRFVAAARSLYEMTKSLMELDGEL